MSTSDLELSPQKQLAAQMLLGGMTRGKVAEALGMTRRHLYNWEQTPEFREYLGGFVEDVERATRARLRGLADSALSVVAELAADTEVPPSVRLQAASKILDLVFVRGVGAEVEQAAQESHPAGLSEQVAGEIRLKILGIG